MMVLGCRPSSTHHAAAQASSNPEFQGDSINMPEMSMRSMGAGARRKAPAAMRFRELLGAHNGEMSISGGPANFAFLTCLGCTNHLLSSLPSALDIMLHGDARRKAPMGLRELWGPHTMVR